MSAEVKKWLNRGGIVGVVVGIVLISLAGGDVEGTVQTGQLIAGLIVTGIGVVGNIIRELNG